MSSHSKRTSIYIGESLRRLLVVWSKGDKDGLRSTSSAINAIADRYQEVVRRAMPTLTEGEWCLVWDALNGVWLADDASMAVASVPLQVADAIKLSGAARKWGVDGPALAKKLSRLRWDELLALVDSAERFWARGAAEDGGGRVERRPDRRRMVREIVGEQCMETKPVGGARSPGPRGTEAKKAT